MLRTALLCAFALLAEFANAASTFDIFQPSELALVGLGLISLAVLVRRKR
jgi:hypothetical protein